MAVFTSIQMLPSEEQPPTRPLPSSSSSSSSAETDAEGGGAAPHGLSYISPRAPPARLSGGGAGRGEEVGLPLPASG